MTAIIFKKGTSNYFKQILSAEIGRYIYSSQCCLSLTEDDGIRANHGAADKGPSSLPHTSISS